VLDDGPAVVEPGQLIGERVEPAQPLAMWPRRAYRLTALKKEARGCNPRVPSVSGKVRRA